MRRFVFVALLLWLGHVPSAAAWSWPVDGPVLRPFVFGDDPYAAGQHRGVDIASAAAATVVAPASGTVAFAGTVPRGGRTLTIETADGYSVTLVHLGSISAPRGATVIEGEPVGTVGPTGEPEWQEPYVHLGVRVTAERHGYVDPLLFLPKREERLGTPADAAAPPAEEHAPPAPPTGHEATEPAEATEPLEVAGPPAPGAADFPPVAGPVAEGAEPVAAAAEVDAAAAPPSVADPVEPGVPAEPGEAVSSSLPEAGAHVELGEPADAAVAIPAVADPVEPAAPVAPAQVALSSLSEGGAHVELGEPADAAVAVPALADPVEPAAPAVVAPADSSGMRDESGAAVSMPGIRPRERTSEGNVAAVEVIPADQARGTGGDSAPAEAPGVVVPPPEVAQVVIAGDVATVAPATPLASPAAAEPPALPGEPPAVLADPAGAEHVPPSTAAREPAVLVAAADAPARGATPARLVASRERGTSAARLARRPATRAAEPVAVSTLPDLHPTASARPSAAGRASASGRAVGETPARDASPAAVRPAGDGGMAAPLADRRPAADLTAATLAVTVVALLLAAAAAAARPRRQPAHEPPPAVVGDRVAPCHAAPRRGRAATCHGVAAAADPLAALLRPSRRRPGPLRPAVRPAPRPAAVPRRAREPVALVP